MKLDVIKHYDMLVEEGNDPVLDPPALKAYMDKWDGELFLGLLELDGKKSVLEIGCGTGRLALKVVPFSGRFCGIDISPKTVEAARAHLVGSRSEIICGDFLEYPFSERFDVIYSSLTFMHIEDKERAVEKIAELLETGGRAVISLDKNKSSVIDLGDRKLDIYPDSPRRIAEAMRKCRLSSVETYETEHAYILCGIK